MFSPQKQSVQASYAHANLLLFTEFAAFVNLFFLVFFFSYFKIIRIFLILQETNDQLFNVTGFCSFLRVPKQLQLLLRTQT